MVHGFFEPERSDFQQRQQVKAEIVEALFHLLGWGLARSHQSSTLRESDLDEVTERVVRAIQKVDQL